MIRLALAPAVGTDTRHGYAKASGGSTVMSTLTTSVVPFPSTVCAETLAGCVAQCGSVSRVSRVMPLGMRVVPHAIPGAVKTHKP